MKDGQSLSPNDCLNPASSRLLREAGLMPQRFAQRLCQGGKSYANPKLKVCGQAVSKGQLEISGIEESLHCFFREAVSVA